ncbi:MAG: hypothetical protein IJU76_16030 [Desulfovibrionaceae bacterium]|nr:hypothetical protein [Desulfovibrionaceae bacterium]
MDYRVFVSREEIVSFRKGAEEELLGYSYEWEGERVVHIHIRPLVHAFGKVSRCLLSKKAEVLAEQFTCGIDFVLSVAETMVCAYRDSQGIVRKTEVSCIPGREELYSRSKGLLEVDLLA